MKLGLTQGEVKVAESIEGARRATEEAGIELTDDELKGIAGGRNPQAAQCACVECYRCGRTIPIGEVKEHNARYHPRTAL